MTGSTGRMHGEIPVMSPPSRPMMTNCMSLSPPRARRLLFAPEPASDWCPHVDRPDPSSPADEMQSDPRRPPNSPCSRSRGTLPPGATRSGRTGRQEEEDMSRITGKRVTAGLALALAATFALSACSMSGSTAEPSTDASTPAMEASEEPMATADPAADLVGPGCAAYAEAVPDGAGSIEGMSGDPVAVAASNNPLLKTLVAAVSGQLNPEVDLVDTLNGGEFTVFAPVDEAFAAIDPATIEALKTDSATLTSILTYHVVPGQLTPDEVVGTQTTVQGGTVEVTGSGDDLMVNDAKVICGGVHTANATVYLIDSVLMPPA